MNTDQRIDELIAGMRAASAPGTDEPVVLMDTASQGDENEFLFFLKPELTDVAGSKAAPEVLNLVLSKIAGCGLEPFAIRVLPSGYLAKHKLLEQHYGVINRLAHDPRTALTASSRATFEQHYGVPLEQANVLGGFEFLARFPEYTSATLDKLWMAEKSTKLGAGTYCRPVQAQGETVYLINGFHPSQIEHYTKPGRSIVVFALRGPLNWSKARNELVGATDPSRAQPESIRGTLLARSVALGIGEISQAVNGVHLSAGPVEGLIELGRYLLDQEALRSSLQWIGRYSFGRALQASFEPAEISAILANVTVPWSGSSQSIYELTEEKEPRDAILLLESVRSDLRQA
ncbi:MAG TPA: hypothetical protein VF173_04005 [Thermoanaerobaculia bacterium]|nr:hypothetical protein [Thermoanaerobaculia bacterium]